MYVKSIFLFLLFLINYTSNFYNIYKASASVSTKISIKPYLNNEFIICIREFLSKLIMLAMCFVSLVICWPEKILIKLSLSAVYSKIKSAIFDMFTSSLYYSTLKGT